MANSEMPLSDPIDLEDEEAKKFLEDLEHPVHSEARAAMLEKAAEAAALLTPKRHRGPDKKPRKTRISKQVMRLNKIVSRALEPNVRQELLEELERQPGDLLTKLDPVALAKWFRYEYAKWLPNVRVCASCKVPMMTVLYNYKKAYTFEPDKSSWMGYKGSETEDILCERVERYVCPKCSGVEIVGRENDVLVLIRTRIGRCGELTILFTSFCLALGMQARLMLTKLDDHLWTEVYFNGEWIPLDASSPEVERLIKDRYLFEKWGWKLVDLYAIEPGKMPVLVDTYRKVQVPEPTEQTDANPST